MDLPLYFRVLRRHRTVLVIGCVAAILLATLSYYRVSWSGVMPKLTPRKAEVWQSQAQVFLTQNGFPAGSRTQFGVASQFTGLASLYAQLAQSDPVLERIKANGGPLDGVFQAIPVVDSTSPLPIVGLFGKGATAASAQSTLDRGLAGFLGYVRASQAAAGIPQKQRVDLQILNAPGQAILIEPRKKTLPVVVFLAILVATLATAFILENRRRGALEEATDDGLGELPASPADISPQPPERPSEPAPDLKPAPLPDPELDLEPDLEPDVTRVRRWA
jgi:hypothetical protein